MDMVNIKTKEDIAILREGGRRHAEIMRRLAAMVAPGVSTQTLEDEARRLIAEGGDTAATLGFKPYGATRPYPAALCVSINDEIVHGIPNENPRTLAEGDVVSLDTVLKHKGLYTDMALTLVVGKAAPELHDLVDSTKLALMQGIKAAKGGKKVMDIASAVERVGLAKNYGIVEDLVGHGVGYDVHEPPYIPNYTNIKMKSVLNEVLRPGMVITIEPMFNLGTRYVTLDRDGYTYRTEDGLPSAHFEHTILITKGSAEILTT